MFVGSIADCEAGLDLVSESPSEDAARVRLVQVTVSTSQRQSSGSRTDSRVS